MLSGDIVGWALAHQFPYKNLCLPATPYGGLIREIRG